MLNPCGPFSQPCFAEVEFPESNFVDQVGLLMKDPEEKERFFQVVFTAVFSLFNSCMMEIRLYSKLVSAPGRFSHGFRA